MEEHYKKNSKCTFDPDLAWGWTGRPQDLPVINLAVSTRAHKSHSSAFKVSDISKYSTAHPLAFIPPCIRLVVLLLKCKRLAFKKACRAIYSPRNCWRKWQKCYNLLRSGEGRRRWGVKAEVLAGLVRVYKALVVAHDLFMTGWDAVVRAPAALHCCCGSCCSCITQKWFYLHQIFLARPSLSKEQSFLKMNR